MKEKQICPICNQEKEVGINDCKCGFYKFKDEYNLFLSKEESNIERKKKLYLEKIKKDEKEKNKKKILFVTILLSLFLLVGFLFFTKKDKAEKKIDVKKKVFEKEKKALANKKKTIKIDCLRGMCVVPAGDFIMGEDGKIYLDHFLDHYELIVSKKVYLDRFKIDQYEVTVSKFKRCVDAGKCSTKNFETSSDNKYYNYGNSNRDNHPMNAVNWYGAREYCRYAGKRLPTEAEWEKAAKGTDGQIYPWGNQNATCLYAVKFENGNSGCGKDRTWPIGSKPLGKSPYGLYDMSGNVYEWVSDWYSSYEGYRNPKGASSGSSRVFRGGAWGCPSISLRSSFRGKYTPYSLTYDLGFRCAKSY